MGFFDDISKKMSDTKKSIAASTEKFEKENKLKKEISNNNQLIERLYSEMGKKVFEAKGDFSGIAGYIDECVNKINEMLEKNKANNVEILKLNNKRVCSNCGAEIEYNAPFCSRCGKEQPKEENNVKVEVETTVNTQEPVVKTEDITIEVVENNIKCPKCGEKVEKGNTFCPNCGEKLSN